MGSAVTALARKARQVLSDPTLRQWLLRRALTRCQPSDRHRRTPDYLSGLAIANGTVDVSNYPDLSDRPVQNPIEMDLAGSRLHLTPDTAASVFDQALGDTEALLALHRFAWIDRAGGAVDPDWVALIWRDWMKRYGEPDASWAWHPYTAAERMINIVAFARTYGLPGPRDETRTILARHAVAIFERLEFFGDGQTGNHLANNGRGLFLGGLALGRPDWVDVGERILEEEAKRMFAPSGVLREGSCHYHLLATRWFAEIAAAAEAGHRASASSFAAIADKCRTVAACFVLPGGLPLIGDISPDCPPDQLVSSLDVSAAVDCEGLSADGWLRLDCAPWHMLSYAAPTGWSPMPGHGHQDFGSFELHYNATRVLCDLGRRSYESVGDPDTAGRAHNTMTIDGAEPYPRNRPYYDRAFQIRTAGPPPSVVRGHNRIALQSRGFARLRGVEDWRRTWRFEETNACIDDEVMGSGRRVIVRHLHTTLPVRNVGGALEIGDFVLAADGRIEFSLALRSIAYGVVEPATNIDITTEATLPWTSTIKISRR